MPSYLVEAYLPHVDPGDRRAHDRATRSAARSRTRDGIPVHFFGSIYVPEDEICFLSFDAPSPGDVEWVAERAGLRLLRIVESFPSDAPMPSAHAGAGAPPEHRSARTRR